MKKIRNKISSYLVAIKESQESVAESIGVSRVALNRWCTNHYNPRDKDVLKRLVNFINKRLPKEQRIKDQDIFYIE